MQKRLREEKMNELGKAKGRKENEVKCRTD